MNNSTRQPGMNNALLLQWVQTNIEKSLQATDGKIAMFMCRIWSTGLNEFVKYYYPQLAKKAYHRLPWNGGAMSRLKSSSGCGVILQ